MKPKIIGYTAGVFDLFHIGHLNIIKKAKAQCDELIVAVTTDEYTYRIKGRYPVIPYEERRKILLALRCVDQVIPQDIEKDQDFVEYILSEHERIGFQRIFKGSDMQGTERWIRLEEKLNERGVEVIFFPYTQSTSSTLIRKQLEKSNPGKITT